ncbi:MAG: DUF5681 domain-containing protein [Hyphomicrobiales bacterium]|nr:DUF5681 domain-containing protein [Hyphomicrobiales bacterium]
MSKRDRKTRKPGAGETSYAVGYGRPPLASRFKPGQSGNPRGRPSGRKNLRTEVRDALTATVTVTMDGRKVRMTKRQAMIEKQMGKALSGDSKAAALLLTLGERYLAEEPRAEQTATAEEDLAILAGFADRLKSGGGAS